MILSIWNRVIMLGREMKISSVIFLVLIALVGCREMVQDEFDRYGPYGVINSILRADSVIKVHVSIAQELNDDPLPVVNDALVVITEDSLIWDTLAYANGLYVSSLEAKELHTYYLEVQISNCNIVTAKCHMPKKPRLKTIDHYDEAGVDDDMVVYPGLDVQFVNPQKVDAYYEMAVRICDYTPYWGTIHSFTDPVLLNEGDFEEVEPTEVVFSNQFIQDSIYTLRIHYYTIDLGFDEMPINSIGLDPLLIVFRSISESYYLYQKSRYMYEIGAYPEFNFTSQSTFNLYSNVKNGYGIFAGASSVISDTVFPNSYSKR